MGLWSRVGQLLATVACIAGIGTACASGNVRGNALEVRRDTAGARPTVIRGVGPLTVGEFQYRGRNTGLRSRWPPMIVRVIVTVANVSSHAAALDVLGGNCLVRLRVYRARRDDREQDSAATPLFDAAAPGFECYVPVQHYSLAPGQTVELQSAGNGPGIAVDPGRYEIAGVVTVIPSADSLHRYGPVRVEVQAGSVRVPPPYQ